MAESHLPVNGLAVHIAPLTGFNRSGVYFLYREGVVVYVGQAVNVRKRVANHIGEGVKDFDAVSFIPCDVDRLLQIERKYIRLMAPHYNNCSVAKRCKESPSLLSVSATNPITSDIATRKQLRNQRALLIREKSRSSKRNRAAR